MRIRRRPPGAQPLAYLLPTDPYPPPQSSPSPPSRDPPPPGDKQQGEGELHLHPAPASATNDSAADLGAARSSSSSPRRPALPPQDDGAVVEERSRGGLGLLGPQQQQQQQQLQQGPADGRNSSLENGLRRHVPELATNQAGELLSNNGVGAAVAATTPATTGAKASKKQRQDTKDTSGGRTKRPPRGPGTLLEGSRCSRKNGRGWRCSQPTLVGYALCQYHLGKGRMKSGSAAATVGRGPGQLGRTEHTAKKTSAAAVAPATAVAGRRGPGQLGRTEHAAKEASAAAVAPAPATAAAPKADVPPPPPTSLQGA